VRRQFESGQRLINEGATTANRTIDQRVRQVTTIAEGVEALLAIRIPGDILGETLPDRRPARRR